MSKITLGIDISKSTFNVALLVNDRIKTKKFDNEPNGFSELVEWLKNKAVTGVHCCMEATGSYGTALATYLYDGGHCVSVVNPARIKGFAQSELARNKTDKADAQLIARFCRMMDPKPWTPKPEYVRELQALVRRLEALQNMYHQECNRKDVSSKRVQASIKAISTRLHEEIESVKKEIHDHIEKHPELSKKSKLLESIPGVGKATIAQVLAFINNVEDFKNAKQLAAFVGLNPKQQQSGTSVKGRTRLSKMGNKGLRKAFYMPAIAAKRCNPTVHLFCENLKKSGKPPMVIIGAAMRKLVHIIFGVLKSGLPFSVELSR